MMKNFLNVAASTGAVLMLTLTLAGCPQPNEDGDDPFIPVTNISGIPGTASVGTPITLSGTVEPPDATNTTITWSVKNAGSTGAAINGNVLTCTVAGTVVVTAAVVNGLTVSSPYTKDFVIMVNASSAFVPVTNISGVPSTATAETPLTLSGTVEPPDASNKTITWSVKNAGSTGAAINGNVLTCMAAGTVVVTATVANGLTASSPYTQDFTITVSDAPPAFIPVTNISGVPGTTTAGTPLTLSGTVEPLDATNTTITWTVKNAGSTGATISGTVLTSTSAGTVVVTAAVANGLTASSPYTQDFTITVSAPVVPDGSAYFYVRFTGPGSNDISVNGDIKLSKSDANYSSLTISVEYPGDYDAFRWLVDGTALDGETEGSVTLYASDYTTGTYWLTVIAEKAGVPYSRRFPFAVVN